MKKTILKAMLFLAFLAIGLQSATAQYVPTDDATVLLEAEIQTAVDLVANLSINDKATQGIYLDNKINLFNFVKDRIAEGTNVQDAIFHGVMTQPTSGTATQGWATAVASTKNQTLPVLHQELEDLLAL